MKNKTRRLTMPMLLAGGLLAGGLLAANAAAQTGAPGAALASDYTPQGADTCLRCHDEDSAFPVVAIFKTKHGRRSDPRTPFAQLQCETCHGPGAKHAGHVRPDQKRPQILNFGRHSTASAAEQNKPCLTCHQRDARMGWQGSEHEKSDVACANCHRIHATQDPMLVASKQPDACFACHLKERADFSKPSAHPVRYGTVRCSDCHSPHGSAATGKLLRKGTVNQTCYSCHADKRGPMLWEHPPVSEDCTLCHSPHGSVYPALLKKPAPLLCQQCHSPGTHPSVAYTANSGLPGSGAPSGFLLAGSCTNCHTQVHGSNHPSGARLMR